MKKRFSVSLTVILILGIVCLGVGYVIAETTGDRINAAYNNKTGLIRYLSKSDDYNPKLETPISWNIQGVPGAPGVPGAGFNNMAYAVNNRIGEQGYIGGPYYYDWSHTAPHELRETSKSRRVRRGARNASVCSGERNMP